VLVSVLVWLCEVDTVPVCVVVRLTDPVWVADWLLVWLDETDWVAVWVFV
jgi:hypothetical protein